MRLMILGILLIPTLTFGGTNTPVVPMAPAIIYGKDNRVEVYEAKASYQLLAKSTATKVALEKLTETSSNLFSLPQESLAVSGDICSTERFASQPTSSDCSGFLIGPDLIATAGHCVDDQSDCDNSAWVFGYQVDPITKKAGIDILSKDIYRCKKIISRNENEYSMMDFALVQLERVVPDRTPLKFRREGKVEDNATLVMIGDPSRLPKKVAGGAKINDNTPEGFFSASTDSFSGNSGSAVINEATLEVEGILVRGEQDYIYDEERGCSVVNVCPEEGCNPSGGLHGEDTTRITQIPELKWQKKVLDAALAGKMDVIAEYLSQGLWIDIYDNKRESMVVKAILGLRTSVVNELVAKEADVNLKDMMGRSPLHHLARFSKGSKAVKDIAQVLLTNGAEVNAVDNAGESALHKAVKSKNIDLVKILLEAGADTGIRNSQGHKAIDLCKWHSLKQRKIRKLLLRTSDNG